MRKRTLSVVSTAPAPDTHGNPDSRLQHWGIQHTFFCENKAIKLLKIKRSVPESDKTNPISATFRERDSGYKSDSQRHPRHTAACWPQPKVDFPRPRRDGASLRYAPLRMTVIPSVARDLISSRLAKNLTNSRTENNERASVSTRSSAGSHSATAANRPT